MDTDSSSLARRTGSAAGFRLAGNLANVLLGLLLGVILARLLSPVEFGIFGIGLGITSFVEIVGSIGIFQALVQRKTIERQDEATAAILQTGGALLLAGILVLAGPAIEVFFGMPGLGPLVQFQSLILVINALGLVPNSRLTRRLAFNRLTAIDVFTRAVGGILSIFLAFRGVAALSLAFGSIATGVCRTCLLWVFAPGRVPILFQLQSAKNLLGYGTGILFIRICNDLAHRMDVLIIGQRLGADVVGLYQRAYHLVRLPLYQFTGAVNTVLFPAMAGLQDENDRFRRGFLGSVGLTSMLAFPVLTLFWTTADLLIPLLYGPAWTGTVPILMSLGFVGYLRIVNNPNGLVTQARGRVVAEAACQAVFVILTVLFVYLGTYFGVQGVVFGIGAASLVFLIMMTRVALSIASISFRHWLVSLRTSTFASLTMALVVLGFKTVLFGHIPASLLLLVLIASGGTAYMLSLRQLLTVRERQILDRFLPLIPPRFKNSFQFCIGTTPR